VSAPVFHRPPRIGLVASLIWLLLAGTALWRWYYPFSSDSFAYVAAAISVVAQGHLTLPFATAAATSLPIPFTGWPAGYPLVIAMATRVFSDPWTAARVVSLTGLIMAVLIWVRATRHKTGGVPAVVALAACSMTAVIAVTAWSEGPFLACVIGAWWSLSAWIECDHRQVRHLVLAAMLLGLAAQFRYAGLFLVPGYLYLTWRHGMRMERATGIMALVVALLPSAVWFYRNQSLAENWRGWSMPAPALWRAPAELCQALGELTILGWLAAPRIQAVAGAAVVIACVILLVRGARRDTLRPTVYAALVFAVPLLLGPAIARGLGWAGFVTARLIWPALPFAALAVFGALEQSVRTRRLLLWVAAVYLAAQTATVVRTPQLHPRWETQFEDFKIPETAMPAGPLLANRGWLAWKATGRSCYVLALRYRGEAELSPDTLYRWARTRGVRQVLWFDEGRGQDGLDRIYGPIAATFQHRDTARVRLEWESSNASLLRIVEGR